MRRRITRAALGAVALASAALAARPARAADDLAMLSVDEVAKLVGAPDVKLLDANPPEVYAKHHLPGAVFVSRETLARALPQDKATRLVFYCKNPL